MAILVMFICHSLLEIMFLLQAQPESSTSPVYELLACPEVLEHIVIMGLTDDRLKAQAARVLHGMLQQGNAHINQGKQNYFL
jgi:hypothetical protein